MITMTPTKARKNLSSMITDRLAQSLRGAGTLPPKTFAALGPASRSIVEGLIADRKTVLALTTLLEAAEVATDKGHDPWLKTEEAAQLMGFSRPYVTALIDAGEFGTGASKTGKGHRRVRASAVEKWLRDHQVQPVKREQAQYSNDMAEFFELPKLTQTKTRKLARIISDARDESLKHRPTRKVA
jgi:excisionase family DNA binding protein